MQHSHRSYAVLLLTFALLLGPGTAAQQAAVDIRAAYMKAEHLVPMRDGVKLFTIVYAPKDTSVKYPFMIHRTPYGSPPYGPDQYRATLGPSPDFAKEGFIFVYQDVR